MSRHWVSPGIFAFFVLACGPTIAPSPSPSPSPLPRPLPSSLPASSSSSMPASSSSPPPDAQPKPVAKIPKELPKLESQALDEQLAVMASLCPVAVKHENGKQWVGCATCMDDPPPLPDGTVAIEPETIYAVHSFVKGSFTKPSAEQIAITMNGCEPHSSNYGGTLVVEKQNGTWVSVRYDSGFHPDVCQSFHRQDGIDILVCRFEDAHQSRATARILAYDFTASTDDISKNWEDIFETQDSTFSSCFMGAEPGVPIVSGRILDFTMKDETNDKIPDVVVNISFASALPNKAFTAVCAKAIDAINNDKPTPDLASALGKKKTVKLVYTYVDATHTFVPTNATKKTLASL